MSLRIISSPQEAKGWLLRREGMIEVFIDPDGLEYVRCGETETPDCLVTFTRMLGLGDLRLVEYAKSKSVRRANRKARRERRELRKRGVEL